MCKLAIITMYAGLLVSVVGFIGTFATLMFTTFY
jgi:hypothetical protein